jgi:1,2-diacylglycerol 3-beta-glucosyltransferase
LPKISILVAARNEASNILVCLQSLAGLDYDPQKIQILIGNDQSTDKTAEIISHFIADKPQFLLVEINSQLNNLQGKANVLAQLSQQATGDWLFFTDADMILPPTWLKAMLANTGDSTQEKVQKSKINNSITNSHAAFITGFTTVNHQAQANFLAKLFAILQACDWTFYVGVMHFFALFNLPLTAMGNNMAVEKKVYDAVGGYQNLAFSLTEDYALFKKIISQNYDFQQLANKNCLAFTNAAPTLKQFFAQRKRWATEFKSFHSLAKIAIFWQGLQLLLWVLLSLLSIEMAICVAFFYLAVILLFVCSYALKTKQYLLTLFAIFYALLQPCVSFISFCYIFSTKKIAWKERTYES